MVFKKAPLEVLRRSEHGSDPLPPWDHYFPRGRIATRNCSSREGTSHHLFFDRWKIKGFRSFDRCFQLHFSFHREAVLLDPPLGAKRVPLPGGTTATHLDTSGRSSSQLSICTNRSEANLNVSPRQSPAAAVTSGAR